MLQMVAGYLFNGRPLRDRLRSRLHSTRGLPLPHYTAPTPRIACNAPRNLFVPPNPATLGAAALEATPAVAEVLSRLTQTPEIADAQQFYRWGRERFGQHWRYADLLTVLWAAATVDLPETYLEIGVLSGRSAAIVGAAAPDCAIFGFDLWLPDYAGIANLGPEFVRSELRKVGHRGAVTLVSGKSQDTLPDFLAERPDLYFDLITIDGDKSVDAAAADFATALPRLKVGGIVVSDDVCLSPHLKEVWQRVVKRDARYVTWEFMDGWLGAAAAIRVADGPVRMSDFATGVGMLPQALPRSAEEAKNGGLRVPEEAAGRTTARG